MAKARERAYFFELGGAWPSLTRCRRKSESPAQSVKKPATTIMMIDTAKDSCCSVDRAAIQPLQKEEEARGDKVGAGPRSPIMGSLPIGCCVPTTTWTSLCNTVNPVGQSP